MKIRLSHLFIIANLLFFSIRVTYAQSTYLPHYTTKNGLPSNNCYFTLQDKKGYIWVGTDAGVSRYDGTIFENFTIDDGLPDNQILQLKEDSKGRIWFLALNGQLSYFYNGIIYNQTNDVKLKQLNFDAIIVSFYEDSKGKIWFGTNKNIIGVWDGKTLIKYSSPNLNRQFINSTINEDKQGNIWAYSAQAVHLFIRNNFVLVANTTTPISFKTVISNKNKSLYFLDKNGLNNKTGAINKLVLKIDASLLNNRLGYIYLDTNKLWLCNNDGVSIIDFNGQTNRILNNIDVSQVIKDNNNNMWFTTKNGIYKYPNTKERIFIYNENNGLSNNSIKSVIKDNKNNLWLGLNSANINILNIKTKISKNISLTNESNFNQVKQLTFDKINDKMYFSSDYGLGYLSVSSPLKSKINYLKETDNSVFVIKNFSLDTTQKLALALSSGVVILSNRKNKFEFSSSLYKENQDYFKDRAYNVFYDKEQKLWFSNILGVSEFNAGILNKVYEKENLLTKRINDIQQLKDGKLAMATDGYGIIIVKDGKVIDQITKKNGLNNNIISKLFVRENNIWAISRAGLNKIVFGKVNVMVNTFDYANNLLIDDLNDLYVDRDTIYLATNNGLVYFANDQQISKTKAPNIYITSITNNKEILNLSASNFILKPGQHNIIFNYSAIDFNNKKIIYKYRLNNDLAWSETRNRRVEISSLEPGNYSFEVSAKSEGSEWSKPANVILVIKKQFWQTWAFIIVLTLLGAYLLYKITVNITKRQKNKEQEQILLKNKILKLEVQALQAMMNPHFVFNVMNSIQHYINTKNTSSANKVLTGFAKLIRKNLEICTKSYINLEEEIEYLNLYLSLEKYRFGEKFTYEITIDEQIDTEEIIIPSMILQPYIENAIWHGIMPKEDGGNVKLDISLKDKDNLIIKIIDNGIGIFNSQTAKISMHQSKGMGLIEERINLLNKIEAKPVQIFIEQNGKKGTTVTILVPIN